MTTSQFVGAGQYGDQTDWSPRQDSVRPTVFPAVFDPSLLNDLAEGLEFLHRQLDDSESELERSREQSRAFEYDARRWEQEAARLRDEAEETRCALDQLRQEFDHSREGSRGQHETIEKIVEELAEMRSARAHLETLATEQQRALVLSLELLKRLNADEAPVASAEYAAQLQSKDCEIADLKLLVEAATEEGTRVDNELAAARLELESRNAASEASQAELAALRSELESARQELQATRTELDEARAEMHVSRADLAKSRTEVTQLQEELKRVAEQEVPALPGQTPTEGLDEEKAAISQKLRDAEAEIALQNAEVESRGAIIVALENGLEEQNTSLRTLEERFLAYAEQVQSMQLERLEMPANSGGGIASRFAKFFSPPKRSDD